MLIFDYILLVLSILIGLLGIHFIKNNDASNELTKILGYVFLLVGVIGIIIISIS